MPHKPQKDDAVRSFSALSAGKRAFYLALGFFMLALGIIGVVVPVMPTTIFIILAAGCFARSSPRFEARLLANPKFGPLVIKWRERGAIPPYAKFYSCLGMAFGYGMFWWSANPGPLSAIAVAIFMLGTAVYILTRPDK